MELIRDKKVIVLLNKSDMNTVIDKSDIQKILNCPIVNVSAKNSTGIDELEECIKKMFFEGNIQFMKRYILLIQDIKSFLVMRSKA